MIELVAKSVPVVRAVEDARVRVVLPVTSSVDEKIPVVPVIAPRLETVA
jgi:hypothetical protein